MAGGFGASGGAWAEEWELRDCLLEAKEAEEKWKAEEMAEEKRKAEELADRLQVKREETESSVPSALPEFVRVERSADGQEVLEILDDSEEESPEALAEEKEPEK